MGLEHLVVLLMVVEEEEEIEYEEADVLTDAPQVGETWWRRLG